MVKRRNFMKVMGASLLSIPYTSDANLNNKSLKDIADGFCKTKECYKQDNAGFSTGYRNIDDYISLSKGDLFVVAARPSMGKSIFVNNIVQKIARRYGIAIGYLYEDGEKHLYQRFISSQGFININNIRRENFNVDSVNYNKSKKLVSDLNIVMDSTRFITLEELTKSAINLVETHGVELLVIDSLENIYVENNKNDYDSAIVLPFIKKLAVKLNIPIIVTSGLNRNLEERDNKHPRLTDLDNYRVFDTHADSIIYLYRDCVYNEYCKNEKEVNIIIDKTKVGITGMTRLFLDGEYVRIVEYNL